LREARTPEHVRESMLDGELEKSVRSGVTEELIRHCQERIGASLRGALERDVDVRHCPHLEELDLYTERATRLLRALPLTDEDRIARVEEYRHAREFWQRLLEQLQALPDQLSIDGREPGDVAARMGKTRDGALGRLAECHADGNRPSHLLRGPDRPRPPRTHARHGDPHDLRHP